MRKFLLFICIPIMRAIVSSINYFRMIELFCFNCCKVLVKFYFPLIELFINRKIFDQFVDIIKSLLGFSDHKLSELAHSVFIFGKVCRKTSFIASGWD